MAANKIDYLVLNLPYNNEQNHFEFEDALTKAGMDGWDLVSFNIKPFKTIKTNSVEMVCVFKKYW